MGTIRQPLPVKLFVGMLSSESGLLDHCAEILENEYGPLDMTSDALPWDGTDYYREEMGPGILRKFCFFSAVIDPGVLPSVKHFTNSLERRFSVSAAGKTHRRINLDPGYLTEAKVVLATTKDFAHRVYIGDGIYAEVTLRYDVGDKDFIPHESTYPDYRTKAYRELFTRAREYLRAALNKGRRA